MPATDNSAVNITINVVDGATGETITRVVKNIDSLGEAGMRNGQKLKQGMQDIGHAGESGGAAAAAGMRGVGEHALSSLDNVRLLRDDLGIRIPRAMEKAIASSRGLSSAIGLIGGGLLGLGAIEIGVRVGTQIYELYKKFIDVNGQVDAFQKKLGEAAQQKFFDVASIEDINLNLEKTNEMMAQLQSRRTNLMGSGGLLQMTLPAMFGGSGAGLKELISAYKGIKQEEAGMARQDDDRARQAEDDHKQRLQQIRDRKELASVSGEAAAREAELNARIAEAQEGSRYTRVQTHLQNQIKNRANGVVDPGNPRFISDNPNAGNEQQQRDIASAQIEYGAGRSKQAIGEREEAAHAKAEAGMAGLGVEARALANEQEELRQLHERAVKVGMDGAAYQMLRQSISDKFFQEQTKRMMEEDARSAALEAAANVGGKRGLAKLDAERDVKIQERQRKNDAGEFANVDTLSRDVNSINNEYKNEAGQQQGNFTDRIQQLDAGRADRYASESDRITQSADKTVREIQKAWEDLYGQLGPLDVRRVQSQQALNAEIVKINADAARQRGEAGQRIEDETSKLEDQARRQALPKYQQQTAAIVDDYHERIQKLEELRARDAARDAANADRYRRQELAEEQIKNGKLIEQQRALRDQLAGQLQGLFTNPLEALKRQGEQVASKYAADLLLKIPGAADVVANGGKHGDGSFGLPSIFGHGWGGKHPAQVDAGASQAGSGTHNDNPVQSTTARPHITASSSTLQAATANITIGSAIIRGNVAMPGGGGGGVGGAGGGTGSDAGIVSAVNAQSAAEAGGPASSSAPLDAGGGSWASTASSAASSAPGTISAATKLVKEFGSSDSGASGALDAGASDGSEVTDEAGASAATDASLSEAGGPAAAGGASGLSSAAGQAAGAASGALGIYSAFEGKGGVGGGLQGALAGAQLGAEFGGPVGAVIGAIGGGILGFIGHGARVQAQKYNFTTVRPRLASDLSQYEAGQMDYTSAFDDMTHLITEGKIQTRQMGPGAVSYYNDTIHPEIFTAQERLTREQRSGRSDFGMSAGQFHQGGILRDFGTMATSPDEGWVHAQRNEIMLNQQAAMTHADAAMLMNSGASRSQMADYYGGGGSGTRTAESSGGGEVHFNVTAIDARGVQQFFDDHGHKIRAALNKSFADNSGGGDDA